MPLAAQAGEFFNLIAKGVIDPTKVVRTALEGRFGGGPAMARQSPEIQFHYGACAFAGETHLC
jgi:hypothetical protein